MRIVGIQKIYKFIQKHTDSKDWLEAWIAESRNDDWNSPNDVKARYSTVSILDGNRLIFNVKGNNYRMEVQVSYNSKVVVIKRLGTHAEYERWNK
ncbi:type II toxin-antitoxin system HigB family toxin [uncultured Desulfosarcina sp.]|uniref:type II toxin-antitoxin system HigB family toxin n=1 Tax=uncultured Desulfosarcina sp. TaxID=218289 RepID=UPI00374967AA